MKLGAKGIWPEHLGGLGSPELALYATTLGGRRFLPQFAGGGEVCGGFLPQFAGDSGMRPP